MTTINIAYACNEAYMEQTTVSTVSIFENNTTKANIVIYLVDLGIEPESIIEFKRVVESYKGTLHVVPFDEIAYDLKVNETGRHTKSVYAKLFFGRLEEGGLDKILYLDSDTAIVDDLSDLWATELDGYYCAGVETVHTIEDNALMGLSPDDRAINDGVVLMNLDAWRDDDILEKCKSYIELYNGEPPVLSEGTINAVCSPKIKILPPQFNLMTGIVNESQKKIECLTGRKYYSQKELDYASNKPIIIHYLAGFYNRPWCKKCSHPLKMFYLDYREKTKWKNKSLAVSEMPLRLKAVGFLYKRLPARLFTVLRIAKRHMRRQRI